MRCMETHSCHISRFLIPCRHDMTKCISLALFHPFPMSGPSRVSSMLLSRPQKRGKRRRNVRGTCCCNKNCVAITVVLLWGSFFPNASQASLPPSTPHITPIGTSRSSNRDDDSENDSSFNRSTSNFPLPSDAGLRRVIIKGTSGTVETSSLLTSEPTTKGKHRMGEFTALDKSQGSEEMSQKRILEMSVHSFSSEILSDIGKRGDRAMGRYEYLSAPI